MYLSKRVLGAVLAAPLALAACSEESTFELELLHTPCDAGPENTEKFIPPSADLTIRVTGEGMDPIEVKADGAAGKVELPDVPFGSNRVVTVEAVANGVVVARGESAPFEVKETGTPRVKVLVHSVNEFTTAADANNRCVSMREARAGHVAVRLQDGRVLIAGGFGRVNAGAGESFRKTAEIYDPVEGRFARVADACAGDTCLQAGHARGVLLPDGRVLIAGCETTGGVAVKTAMIYDPETDAWTATEMASARRGHTMHVISGKVLVIGGRDETRAVLDTTEVFDPATGEFTEGPKIPGLTGGDAPNAPGRAFHVGIELNPTTVMIAGGIDGEGDPARSIVVFQSAPGGFNPLARPTLLASEAVGAGGGNVAGKAVVAGGSLQVLPDGRIDPTELTNSVQYFDPTQANGEVATTELRHARLEPCVVAMDANRLLVAGGLVGTDQPTDFAEVLSWDVSNGELDRNFVGIGGTEGRSKMKVKRAWATCTRLDDDRILVTGGLSATNGPTSVVSSAETFLIPRPAN